MRYVPMKDYADVRQVIITMLTNHRQEISDTEREYILDTLFLVNTITTDSIVKEELEKRGLYNDNGM